MTGILDTYQRVCTLARGHDGPHRPFHDAPSDEHGNKAIEHPRCVHVDPVPQVDAESRYRIIFEMVDPRMPEAGWHEVGCEHETLAAAQDQADGIARLSADGDLVRSPRIERATIRWVPAE